MGSFRNGVRAAAFQCILGLITCCVGLGAGTAVAAAFHSHAHDAPDVQALDSSVSDATISEVTNGSLDTKFTGASFKEPASRGDVIWLRVSSHEDFRNRVIPVLVVHAGMLHQVQVYAAGTGNPLPPAGRIPEFAGARDTAFLLPAAQAAAAGTAAGSGTVYVRIAPPGAGFGVPRFSISTLDEFVAEGASRARMITLAFGALAAMAVASLLIWIVLADRAFILYFTLFMLQALYVAYFSGQGFEWPWLSAAAPLTHYTWNVLSALSGAAACLFVRDIADLRRFLPRSYTVFGWLAGAFVLLTFANLIKLIGYEDLVNNFGNVLFLGSAVYTLVVAFVAWRRGSRSAGWFLVAWTLLEAFTIATTVRLLLNSSEEHDRVIYFGLPLSMVAAALLIALGIADRLRDQRRALTEAERHAQIDSLTGVLNRRSLIERLDAACLRARARGLPISLLFIDLDHFKEINDSFGHPAGDACLSAIIAPIQAELRQSDVIGRYGGEEFVVILSSADTAAAHPIAQRILERVAGVRIEGFGPPIALTCSIGVATSDMLGVWGEHLIAQADAAVYAAKRSGRNRVQVAVPMAA
jgi:diguanylate cyclase (GGDEF)-like protein